MEMNSSRSRCRRMEMNRSRRLEMEGSEDGEEGDVPFFSDRRERV
jgi:hypothetical protein